MFTLNKKSGGEVRVIGDPWCFFQRMRSMCGGQVIEDITNYNRVHEMISKLQSTDEKERDNIEGFGIGYKNHADTQSLEDHPGMGGSRRVSFKPLSGILTQQKLIPLNHGKLSFDF